MLRSVPWITAALSAIGLLSACSRPSGGAEYSRQREDLVRKTMEGRGIRDPRVLAAMRKVPRHQFVPEHARADAYTDNPLPIGHGQTISQPYIVAYMTEAVSIQPTDRCLEVGTGSGYQAAVLAELCDKVYTVEYFKELSKSAKENLQSAGYGPTKVEVATGDGYAGWPEEAPFQVIVITAAPKNVPQPLLDQLAVGGRLIVPVGPRHAVQELELWTRESQGSAPASFQRKRLLSVRFVPFLGERANQK